MTDHLHRPSPRPPLAVGTRVIVNARSPHYAGMTGMVTYSEDEVGRYFVRIDDEPHGPLIGIYRNHLTPREAAVGCDSELNRSDLECDAHPSGAVDREYIDKHAEQRPVRPAALLRALHDERERDEAQLCYRCGSIFPSEAALRQHWSVEHRIEAATEYTVEEPPAQFLEAPRRIDSIDGVPVINVQDDIDRVVRWLDYIGEDQAADKLLMARRRHREKHPDEPRFDGMSTPAEYAERAANLGTEPIRPTDHGEFEVLPDPPKLGPDFDPWPGLRILAAQLTRIVEEHGRE